MKGSAGKAIRRATPALFDEPADDWRIEALRDIVDELEHALNVYRHDTKIVMHYNRQLQEQNNELATKLGDARSELKNLKDFYSRRLDELESLRDIQARGLLDLR